MFDIDDTARKAKTNGIHRLKMLKLIRGPFLCERNDWLIRFGL